jgi:aldehyde dehydrogenase (NAD+)
VLRARATDLVDLNVLEVGSIRSWAEFLQVGLPIQHFRDMAERVLVQFPFEKPMPPTLGPTLAQGVVRREPRGVAALVSAYNAPTFLNLMKLAPALAAGCTVILKPAPATPLEALLLGEVADEAELPPGVLNIVTGGIAASRALTSHPGVDGRPDPEEGDPGTGRQVGEHRPARRGPRPGGAERGREHDHAGRAGVFAADPDARPRVAA